ncbi:MAG: HAMP domain-containing sensor histidine kinase [Bacteroidetes bacterium]|nr:HAMP domain-containing sensor histidine kinase [Bacteroidota bacterium]
MNRLRVLSILMVIAIVGITGFQVYWLMQNYAREKKTLTIKTEAAFQKTITQLQAVKFKLDNFKWQKKDSAGGKNKVQISIRETGNGVKPSLEQHRADMVSTINVIRSRMNDSLKGKLKTGMIISMNNTYKTEGDSVVFNREIHTPMLPPIPTEDGTTENHIIQLLFGVDSLQDSLRIGEIDSAYQQALQKQKLNIPFTITRNTDSTMRAEVPGQVTVGFAHPITYELHTGNTFPYLLTQLWQPILFSFLLLGITILSFVLLYRSLVKQQRLSALKNEFISNITHELKTPIATVGVAIEALKNFNAMHDPVRTREYLDISSNELQRLSLLVDKVLKLSMFEKKEMDFHPELINLESVVQEVVTSLKLQLEKFRSTITVIPNGDLHLKGDRLHLLSVVFNLVDNALKYSRTAPEITILLDEKEETVQLQVKDNGIGIPPEYREKIFEKFFRVPHGDTHNAKGYGLGLSYVAQVVKQHKGTIAVESEPGKGTNIIINFPKQAS